MRNLAQVHDETKKNTFEFIQTTIDSYQNQMYYLALDKSILLDDQLVCQLSCDIDWQWIQYLSDNHALFCAATTGEMVLVDIESKDIQEIGCIDGGIRQVSWNALADVVLICTGNHELLTLTSETWDVLAEAPLTVVLKSNTPVEMCWKADGTAVAVNVHEEEGNRKILIFNSELECRAMGRFEDGRTVTSLNTCIDWCPNHSLLASCTRRKSKCQVVFFEPNGLRHRDFTIPSIAESERVAFIRWNIASTILAVAIVDEVANTSRLQLWMRNNYHWYLKHESMFQSNMLQFLWHPENSNTLYLWLNNGETIIKTYDWVTTVGIGHDSPTCTAAVIDGRQLLLTHFHQAIIPPPMSSASLKFDYPVVSTSFSPSADQVMVALSDGSVHYTNEGSIVACPWQSRGVGQILWVETNPLSFLAVVQDKLFYVVKDTAKEIHINAPVLRLISSRFKGTVYFHLENGEINRFNDFDGEICCETMDILDHPCSQICAIENDEDHVVFLTLLGSKLRVNNIVMETGVGSMEVSHVHGYLMFTTLGQNPELKLIGVDDLLENPTAEVAVTRNLERGSRIVAVTPEQPLVVLQMPRGNLEGIYPHRLVEAMIDIKLGREQYGEALEICRKHRVDMQRIVNFGRTETGYECFTRNCVNLIDQIPPKLRVNRLNLFITNLREESEGSVNSICDTLREKIEQVDPHGLLHSLLTCDLKKNPQEYSCALRRLQLKENVPSRQKALAYLTHLTSVDELFAHALGLYDFDLVYAVLQHLQKDPAEYMATIQSFQAYEGAYKKFKVDLYLERYQSALDHLREAMEVDQTLVTECLEFIKTHSLSEYAMSIFSRKASPAVYDSILEIQGDHLSTQNQYAEAAVIFMATKPPRTAKAMDAFRAAGNWRMALVAAHDVLSKQELQEFGYALASDMTDQIGHEHRPQVAAEILVTECDDVDEAISVLVRAGLWENAYQTALTHGRQDLVETEVIPGVEYALDTFTTDIEDRQKNYLKTKRRLDEVRRNRELFKLHLGQEPDAECETGSVYSVASSAMSAVSNFSVGSHNSSRTLATFSLSDMQGQTVSHVDATKSVRDSMTRPDTCSKQKRKVRRQRLKKGGSEEEAYLVKCLAELVPTVKYQQEIRDLITVGIYSQYREMAIKLQRTFDELMQQMQTNEEMATIEWNFPSIQLISI